MYVAQERRAYILRLLQQRGSIRSAVLARELGVTDETVRTDLVALQARGLLERIHGGARYILPLGPSSAADNSRLDVQLATLAAEHITAGTRIYLDASPYALALVAQLQNKPCTLITCSVDMLQKLQAEALPHRLICPGGTLDKESGLLLQEQTEEMLLKLQPDVAVISPPALRPRAAAFTTAARARCTLAACRAATHTYALVPAEALTAMAPHTIEAELSLLFTEDALPPGFDGLRVQTVPHITPEDAVPDRGFDY